MKNRKIVIGVIALVLSIIGMINLNICNLASETVKYSFKLDSYVTLKSVSIDNNNIPLKSLLSQNENLTFDEDKNELSGIGETEVTIKASSIDNIYIEFSDVEPYNIVFKKNGITQDLVENKYLYSTSILNIVSRCFNGYSAIYFVLLLPLMYFSIYAIYRFFNKANSNDIKLRNIICFILSVFIIYFVTFYTILAISELLILGILVLVLACGIYFLRKNIKENIQNIFIYMATIIGVAMIFLVPPFNVPDEYSHFVKSFAMSRNLNADDKGYYEMPSFIVAFSNKYTHSVHESKIKYTGVNYFSDVYLGCNYNVEDTELSTVDYTNTKYLSPFTYIPSIVSIYVGRHLGFSPMLLLILCRFVDLFIVLVLAYVAINITPKFKKVFFIVCLFPIFLQQAAAINQDFLTNILCILFVAYVLKIKYSENIIKTKNMIIFLILGVLISCCKFGYFPITLTMFLIPNDKFRSKREAILFKLGIFLLTILVSYIVGIAIIPNTENSLNNVSVNYILHNPIRAIKTYINTALIRLQSDLLTGLFDGFLYSTVQNCQTFNTIIILCYLLLIFTVDKTDDKLTKKSRALLILISVLMFGIIYTAAYSWNTIGVDVITGIQSRYFIPALLVLYMAIPSFIKIKSENKNLVYSNIMLIVYSIVLFTIINSVYR